MKTVFMNMKFTNKTSTIEANSLYALCLTLQNYAKNSGCANTHVAMLRSKDEETKGQNGKKEQKKGFALRSLLDTLR